MSELTDKTTSAEALPDFGVIDLAGVMPWISAEMSRQVSSSVKVLSESDPEYLGADTVFFSWGDQNISALICEIKKAQGLTIRDPLPCSLAAVIGGELFHAQYLPRLSDRFTDIEPGGLAVLDSIPVIILPWDQSKARRVINIADTQARCRPSFAGVFPEHSLLLGESNTIPETF